MLTHSPRNPNIFHQNISLTINLFKIFCIKIAQPVEIVIDLYNK